MKRGSFVENSVITQDQQHESTHVENEEKPPADGKANDESATTYLEALKRNLSDENNSNR